jgi:PIN domain nuclease of toxin-antitoxin system
MSRQQALVLDTHTWLWFVDGNTTLKPKAVAEITSAAMHGSLLIPAICVWEIAMLQVRGRLTLNKPVKDWVGEALDLTGTVLMPLSADISIESCMLPGVFHADPADRMIVATARVESATILTRDQRIIDYGQQGFVSTRLI